MIRKSLIALTAATVLGAGTFVPHAASARPIGGFQGAHGVHGTAIGARMSGPSIRAFNPQPDPPGSAAKGGLQNKAIGDAENKKRATTGFSTPGSAKGMIINGKNATH